MLIQNFELEKKYKKEFEEVEKILEKEFKHHFKGKGFNRVYWRRKKQLLKEMYGIDWLTPAELNPGVIFD